MTDEALADRQVADRGARVLVDASGRCPPPRPAGRCRSARRSRTGAPTRRSVVVPSFSPIVTVPTFDDWARISADRQRPAAAVVRLADRRGRRPGSSAPIVNCVSRRDEPLLERAGDRERLEGRARLVGEPDRAVLARVVGRLADLVGVDARPVGHREHLAVARVHHDRGRAAAAGRAGRPRRAPPRCAPGSRRRSSAAGPRRAPSASTSTMLTGLPGASLTTLRRPSVPWSVSSLRLLEAGQARSCRCRRCRAPARRASPAGRCGAARRPCRSPRCRAC